MQLGEWNGIRARIITHNNKTTTNEGTNLYPMNNVLSVMHVPCESPTRYKFTAWTQKPVMCRNVCHRHRTIDRLYSPNHSFGTSVARWTPVKSLWRNAKYIYAKITMWSRLKIAPISPKQKMFSLRQKQILFRNNYYLSTPALLFVWGWGGGRHRLITFRTVLLHWEKRKSIVSLQIFC